MRKISNWRRGSSKRAFSPVAEALKNLGVGQGWDGSRIIQIIHTAEKVFSRILRDERKTEIEIRSGLDLELELEVELERERETKAEKRDDEAWGCVRSCPVCMYVMEYDVCGHRRYEMMALLIE